MGGSGSTKGHGRRLARSYLVASCPGCSAKRAEAEQSTPIHPAESAGQGDSHKTVR